MFKVPLYFDYGATFLWAVRDEQGVEAFYNVAITPWLRLSGDLQVVEPFRDDKDTAVFLGLSTQIKF